MFFDYNFKYYNYRLVLYMVALSVIGILVVASASGQDSSTVTKQIIGILVGFALAIGLSIIDYHRIINLYALDYAVCILLLGAVLVMGHTAGGATRWIDVPGIGRIQPSEFVKDDLEEVKKRRYLFVAGGVGSAPVYPQVKWLKERGIDVDVVEGAKTKDMLILEEEMRSVAGNLYITTDDGSYVRKGMVTDVVKDLVENQGKKYDVCVAIGPMIMMKFVCKLTKELGIPTIVSMNPIMVDGTGMCGACRVSVGGEVKFACVDGPEFDGHLVDFDQAMKRQQMYKTEEGRAILRLREGATHHGGWGNCGGEE